MIGTNGRVTLGSMTRPFLLLLGLGLLYLLLASLTTLWDRDEPRFARAAVEMVHTGDYLVPRFDGELRPDKPPMVYWWMIPWILMFGAVDLAVRVPSIIGSLIAATATFHIARNLAGDRVAIRAMGIGGLMPLPLIIGTAATADGLLLAGVSVALAILVDRALHGSRTSHFPLLVIALAFALLAKGPVGLVIFLLASATASYWGRDSLQLGRDWWAKVAVASLLAVTIFLCWGIPANEATDGELARVGIGRHLIQRSTEALESHGGDGILGWLLSLPFYLPILLLGAAPGSALLVPLVTRSKLLFKTRGQAVLIAALIFPTLLLMTLVATKLPHYILAAFPGVAVAVALVWTRAEQGQLDESALTGLSWQIGRRITALLLISIPFLWAVAIQQGAGNLLHVVPVAVAFALSALLTLAMKPGTALFGRRGLAGPVLATVTGIALVAFGAGAMEQRWKVARPLAAVIEQSEAEGIAHSASITTLGYDEPSLVFALDRDPAEGQKTVPALHERFPDGISQWLAAGGPAWLLASVVELSRSGVDLEQQGCQLIWSTGPEGILNYSNGSTVSLQLWLLSGP